MDVHCLIERLEMVGGLCGNPLNLVSARKASTSDSFVLPAKFL